MNTSDDFIGQRQRRIANLMQLRDLGINPFPSTSKKDASNKDVQDKYNTYEGKELTLAGRLMAMRNHGKLIFGDIQDQSGRIQLCIKNDTFQSNEKEGFLSWEHLNLVDVGDFVQVTGTIGKTQQGQITIFVTYFKLLTKSIRPLPHKLDEKEQQFRRRYLDLTINPDHKERFLRKVKFWQVSRDYMNKKGFIEVETPVLEHVTGGADARPFVTYHNDLDQNFYLRISTELYQKRLIGAGFEKVYTLAPNFRNEGMSDEHYQEYLQLEWYWAYADYKDNMNLVKDMFRNVVKEVYGTTKFSTRGHTFDLNDDWQEVDYQKIIKERFNIDIFTSSEKEMADILKEQKVKLDGAINRNRLIDNLWKLIRKTLSGPAFLVNEPKFMSPLAKSKPENPELTERFHIILAGSELGNGYSELNDPLDQLDRFLEQQKLRDSGDDEAQMLDIDFVEMLEYGMPPVSGYAHSDRLFWFLENCTPREAILFPQLKTEVDELTKKIYKGVVNFNTKQLYKDLDNPKLFSIHKDAAKKWPSMHIGFAIIKDITVTKTNTELEKEKKNLYDSLANLTTEDINAMPEILSYRKMYKDMGIDWHSRRPSPEALLRRIATKKGLYTINTCVDAYNLVVMKHHISSGAFDLDKIQFPTELRLAKEGEQILLLGDTQPTIYKPTEIAYFDQAGGYNIDFNYRDAQRTSVTENTKNIVINIDGVYDITREDIEKSLKETIDMITKYCGGKVEVAGIVSAE